MRVSNTARQSSELFWACTAGAVSEPTAISTTTTTATLGRLHASATWSTSRGRVSAAATGTGRPRRRSGGGAQHEDEALEHQRTEQPVRGQVGEWPGGGPEQKGEPSVEERDLPGGCLPPAPADGKGVEDAKCQHGDPGSHMEVVGPRRTVVHQRPRPTYAARRGRP